MQASKHQLNIHWYKKFLNMLEQIQLVLCYAGVAAIVAIVFFQVLARSVFNHPFNWGQEVSSGLMIWMAMNGAAVLVRRSQHVSVAYFLERLHGKYQRALHFFNYAVMLFFSSCILVGSYHLIGKQMRVTLGSLQIPRTYYFALPAFVFALTVILYLVEKILDLFFPVEEA